jgi:hypothetical protein
MSIVKCGFVFHATIAVSILFCGCAHEESEREISQQALPASVAMPITVDQWNNGTITRVEFLRPFRLSDYKKVMVLPADTSSVVLPAKDENTYAPVTGTLSQTTDIFTRAVRAKLEDIIPVEASTSGQSSGGKTMKLQLRVRAMEPGSYAQRAWVGGGFGHTYTDISGDVVDAETGQTLLRFEDESRGVNQGLDTSYDTLLAGSVEIIGQHVGILLEAFSRR